MLARVGAAALSTHESLLHIPPCPQIVSTFLKSLDIPWPTSFGVVMARVSVINLNLVQLPKAVRLRPSSLPAPCSDAARESSPADAARRPTALLTPCRSRRRACNPVSAFTGNSMVRI